MDVGRPISERLRLEDENSSGDRENEPRCSADFQDEDS